MGAPREVIETNIYDRSEGPERHRQFDMKQLLTEQDEDTIGEYLKKKYADSHERRYTLCVTCITHINYVCLMFIVCVCVCVHARPCALRYEATHINNIDTGVIYIHIN